MAHHTTTHPLLRSQPGKVACQQFFGFELAVAGCMWLCLAPCLPQAERIAPTCAQLVRHELVPLIAEGQLMQSKLLADKMFSGLGQPLAALGKKMFPAIKKKHT